LTAYTGASIWDIASELESIYSQSIWHRFVGLPGSMGGSIVGNAGCFGLTVANNFVSAEILDIHTGTVSTYMRDDMGFVYRGSRWKGDTRYFVISAVFDLSYVSQEYASDVDNIYFREHKQPK
jgi:UDP-N-acetylmuramate dehydrogenase